MDRGQAIIWFLCNYCLKAAHLKNTHNFSSSFKYPDHHIVMQSTPLLAPTFVLPHPEFYFLEQQSSPFTVNWGYNAASASFVQGTSPEMQRDLCADASVCCWKVVLLPAWSLKILSLFLIWAQHKIFFPDMEK